MTAPTNFIHVVRLHPGHDLRAELEQFATATGIQAGWVISCVGSLTQTHLRFANAKKGTHKTGFFEIVSLAGTISSNGCHLHACVADSAGVCTGGHVLSENYIYTTAEIVIGTSANLVFSRTYDSATGFNELAVTARPR